MELNWYQPEWYGIKRSTKGRLLSSSPRYIRKKMLILVGEFIV